MSRKDIQTLNGYRLIYKPEHHRAIRSRGYKGYVYEHILVAEDSLGRKIRDGEDVHHLDGNKSNNNKENIIVLEHGQHTRLHGWLRSLKSTGYGLKTTRACKVCGRTLKSYQKIYCSVKCMTNGMKNKNRPSKEQLMKDIAEFKNNKSAIGRKYKVSSVSIRKWLINYGII